jgi:hypothetical protein
MTTRRWMIAVAVAGIDSAAMAHKSSNPLAVLATFATIATVLLAPALILLLAVASDD